MNHIKPAQSDNDLYKRVIKGGSWVFLSKIVLEILVTLRLIVLARLLAPRDFGLLGISLLLIAILNQFSSIGLREALIQKKADIKSYLNTAWTINIFRGIVLFVILFFIAPYAAVFFDGSGRFEENQILKPAEFIINIRDSRNPVSQYLLNSFSENTRLLISEYDKSETPSKLLIENLTEELNNIVEDPKFYDEQRFEKINLSSYARILIEQPEEKQDIIRMNRRLLEEVYDGQIKATILDRIMTTQIIRIMGILLLIGGFGNIGTVYFQKELQFHKQFILQSVATTVNVIATISLALIYRNVWSLVYGKLISSSVNFVLGYIMRPIKPRISLKLSKAKELWEYGKHLFWCSILNFFIMHGDDIFVGKVLGPIALGFYRYAYKIADMMATEIGNVISQVTFPAYSKLQDNLLKLRAGYIKALQVLTLLCYPVAFGLFVLAHDFTAVVLGEKWLPMVPTLQILCIFGLVKCNQGGRIFKALGRTDIPRKIATFRLILLVLTIYPLTKKMGLPGTALSVSLSTVATIPVMLFNVKKLIGHTFTDYLRVISLPLFSSLIMSGSILLTRRFIPEIEIVSLSLLIILGVVVYISSALVLSIFDRKYDVIILLKDIKKGF